MSVMILEADPVLVAPEGDPKLRASLAVWRTAQAVYPAIVMQELREAPEVADDLYLAHFMGIAAHTGEVTIAEI